MSFSKIRIYFENKYNIKYILSKIYVHFKEPQSLTPKLVVLYVR